MDGETQAHTPRCESKLTHCVCIKILNIKKETTMFKKIYQGRLFLRDVLLLQLSLLCFFGASCQQWGWKQEGRQVLANYERAWQPEQQTEESNSENMTNDTHPHTLMSWSKTGSLLRPGAGSQGPKRSIPDALQKRTHLHSYMHIAATSVCRLAMSGTCMPVSQRDFTSQWQGRVSRRGHDFSVWSLHVFTGALQLPSSSQSND